MVSATSYHDWHYLLRLVQRDAAAVDVLEFLEVAEPVLSSSRRRTADSRGSYFVKRLMEMTHHRWLFRNFRNKHVYFCKLEGLAAKQREEILARVKELVLADPADLPEEH